MRLSPIGDFGETGWNLQKLGQNVAAIHLH
jgi:hypothetical protein